MATFENLEIVLRRDELGRIFGTNRDELAYGDDRNDRINLGAGNDILFGQEGDDKLVGLAGDDILVGGSGNDLLRGGNDDDTLDGQSGDDELLGQNGDDLIRGRDGGDLITGGTGNDVMVGGEGNDLFFFDPAQPGEGRDRIIDFEIGEDLIALDFDDILESDPQIAVDIAEGADLFEALDDSETWELDAHPNGGDLLVFHPNGSIRLVGVSGVGVDSFADISDALLVLGIA